MTGWPRLLQDFLAGRISAAVFHDRFFVLWRKQFDGDTVPAAVERLFFVVEAFTPDPALRDPALPWEADEAELRAAARLALGELMDHGG